jgi:Putative Flp pilus-assembly TadE/G-like
MKSAATHHFLRIIKDQSGQILPWMVFLNVLFLGAAGLTLDLGHAYVCYRELQASTDAAALAGAYEMSSSTATSTSVKAAVTSYSSMSTGANADANLPSPTINTTLSCLTTVTNEGVLCSSSTTGDNAIVVTQTATVPTLFIRALGVFGINATKSLTLSATSTAAMRGATNSQENVAIVIDTTASMASSDSDASCGNTRIYCALQGVQTLLQELTPCTASSTSTSCTGYDGVSLFTFPNIQANQASDDTTCPTSNPNIPSYYTPTPGATWVAPTGSNPTYQVSGYLTNYISTNKPGGSLNTSSALAIAAGASPSSSCKGLQTPGGDGTYYAGAIYAALSSLAAQHTANPSSKNALIILSDGDASSTKITGGTHAGLVYGSLDDQCQQAIAAAKTADSNTTVYTIAYGAANSGCSTDTSGALKGLTPCQAMHDMATSAATFYSDATASQNNGQCTSSSNPNLTLNQIFSSVESTFTVARLIPNGTT